MSPIFRSSTPKAGQAVAFAFGDFEERRARQESERIAAAELRVAEQLSQEVDERVDAVLPAMQAAVEAIHAARAEWLAHWQNTALHLATAIAARVIRREVRQAPEITLDLVKEALELAAGSADVQLRMHPDDLTALGMHVKRIVDELGRLGEARIVADASMERGSCRVDTRFGSIDQQFEAQLARIELELA